MRLVRGTSPGAALMLERSAALVENRWVCAGNSSKLRLCMRKVVRGTPYYVETKVAVRGMINNLRIQGIDDGV